MSELASQFVVVWPEIFNQSGVVLAVKMLFFWNFSGFETSVVLTASPGYEISSTLECWSPVGSEESIVFSLERLLHFYLFVDGWDIVVISTIFHEAAPHKSTMLIVIVDRESRLRLFVWGILGFSELFGKRLSSLRLLICDLSLDLLLELVFEEDVLSLLLEFFSMFFV